MNAHLRHIVLVAFAVVTGPIASHAEIRSAAPVPRLAGAYVNVYKPAGDVFPGPDEGELIAGKFYREWVPNDHCFVRDENGVWHAFGITHPRTDLDNVHLGENLLFHAAAPPGTLREVLKPEKWRDRPKVLPPAERPDEIRAIHAPTIVRHDGCYVMIYGPTPMRSAVSHDLVHWKPTGPLEGAPAGRDPNVLRDGDRYYMVVCGDGAVTAAVSRDLRKWTPRGRILEMPEGVDPESPFLVRYRDAYYLFVCGWNGVWDRKDLQGAYQHVTYVYRSTDPLHFGRDDLVTTLDAHAPEVFQDEAGDWFISSAEWPYRGVSIAPLRWE
ncbi:hypothetical protein JCM19992_06640 [Thermostilla marina]